MILLGGYVAIAFRETRFVARRERILRRGVAVVRGSRVLLVILAATFVVNGLAGNVGRVYQLRLVEALLVVVGLLVSSGTFTGADGRPGPNTLGTRRTDR
jgi:hypothetical protein